jgi:hypothetical protein
VTPSLIWGRVSAGCVRMQEPDLRLLFQVARRHPSMSVAFLGDPDRVDGRIVEPDRTHPALPGCDEAALGVRRMTPLVSERGDVHDRICGGVDHWYSLGVENGDLVSVDLRHAGDLRVELYGARAISAVASSIHGLDHRISPGEGSGRSERYLRVTSTGPTSAFSPYTLRVRVGAQTSPAE